MKDTIIKWNKQEVAPVIGKSRMFLTLVKTIRNNEITTKIDKNYFNWVTGTWSLSGDEILVAWAEMPEFEE